MLLLLDRPNLILVVRRLKRPVPEDGCGCGWRGRDKVEDVGRGATLSVSVVGDAAIGTAAFAGELVLVRLLVEDKYRVS